MTKKITPDPPPACSLSSPEQKNAYLRSVIHQALDQVQTPPSLDALATTAPETVTPDPSQAPTLFAVQPDICAKIALSHVSRLLKTAELNADEISSHVTGLESDLLWSVIHSMEMARSVVDSLLGGTKNP